MEKVYECATDEGVEIVKFEGKNRIFLRDGTRPPLPEHYVIVWTSNSVQVFTVHLDKKSKLAFKDYLTQKRWTKEFRVDAITHREMKRTEKFVYQSAVNPGKRRVITFSTPEVQEFIFGKDFQIPTLTV